jgi:hypothetical protein
LKIAYLQMMTAQLLGWSRLVTACQKIGLSNTPRKSGKAVGNEFYSHGKHSSSFMGKENIDRSIS